MATCCVQLTDTISQLCCDDGSCDGNAVVEIELVALHGGVLRDAETNEVVPTGIVWSTRELDGTCSWTSCELPVNTELCPPNDNLYRLHYTINGVRYPAQNIYLDGATTSICGTTMEVSEVVLCGPVNTASPLCEWIKDCIDSAGGGSGFTCADLATCTVQDLGNVTGVPAIGQVLTWDGVNWTPDDITGVGGFNCNDLAVCVVSSLQDVSTTVPAIGQSLVWNGVQWAPQTVSGGGGGQFGIVYWTSGLTSGTPPNPPSETPLSIAIDTSTRRISHWWNVVAGGWWVERFTESMVMTNIGTATIATDGTQQAGWTAATDCTFRAGKFIWADPELQSTLPTNVTVGVFKSTPGGNTLMASATLNAGAQPYAAVDFDGTFTLVAGETIRWWFTNIGTPASLDPQHTFSATWLKDQDVL